MISKDAVLRVTRRTDNLETIADMYKKALGFESLAEFKDEDGFDGVVLGHPHHNYHLEFTNRHGASEPKKEADEGFLVFFLPCSQEWEWACRSMIDAGFSYVTARNPVWRKLGKTFEDADGNRVVIQNRDWAM
ncbi:glyoxalase [Vibrio sp. HA2012]|uniref:VOC family protein n=1 Tax=Vibrio sp. HA2012 TaxID=1971595 RepID=UPI000C2B6A07|nr:VOC family protein [Vibrio sp. HA2012]PJC87050.1 glyoxalase [Vibrio sp. HA2012]